MRKGQKAAAAAVVLLLIMTAPNALAEEHGDDGQLLELAEALPESDGAEIQADELTSPAKALEAVEAILKSIPQLLTAGLKEGAGRGAALLLITALSAIASTVTEDKNCIWAVELAGISAVILSSIGVVGLIESGRTAVQKLADWSGLVLPVMASTAASAGAVSSAASKYALASFGLGLLNKFVASVSAPLTGAFIALSVSYAATDNPLLKSVADLVKSVSNWTLTASASVVVFCLAVSGAASASVDALAAKTVKTALSALPVVGGITSDAASAVLVGAGVVRNTAGLIGIIGVLSVCLEPIISLAANVLMYKFAAAAGACFATERLKFLTESISQALNMMLGACGLTAFVLFFSLVSLMKAVG